MKKPKILVSLVSILALVFGLALTGCAEKSEEEKAAEDLAGQAEDAAKAAEAEAEKLKKEAEKKLGQ